MNSWVFSKELSINYCALIGNWNANLNYIDKFNLYFQVTPPSWIHIYSTYKHIKHKAIQMRRNVMRNVIHTKSIYFVSNKIFTLYKMSF